MKNIIKYIFCTLIILACQSSLATGTYTTIASEVTLYSEYYPNNKSKFSGSIIFENGSGTDISEWTHNKEFFQCVKKLGSVFLYDRNGLGKSPPDFRLSESNPITGSFINEKFFKLLKARSIKPPYIIVAHSYGGIYAGYFTLKNPSFVKALILVDPVPKDFNFSTRVVNSYESSIKLARIEASHSIYKKYGGQMSEVAYQLIGLQTAKKEVSLLGNINPNIPVVIVSSSLMEKSKPLMEDWLISQKQWLNKNRYSKIITVNSGYFIMLEQPQIVCQQIKMIINNLEKARH
jgi:hypothetical protein